MALDPEFVRKIQERKVRREALESKYAGQGATRSRSSSGSGGGGRKKSGPVYRSVSMLSGDSVTISGEEARKRAKKAEYKG